MKLMHFREDQSRSQLDIGEPRLELGSSEGLLRVFKKTRITPKAGNYHRRALSLVEEYLDSIPSETVDTQARTMDSETSIISQWSFSTRTGFIPGNTSKVNQDSYLAVQALFPDRAASLFGVCDGHGVNGHDVSQYLKARIPKLLHSDPACLSAPTRALANAVVRSNQEVLTGTVDVGLSGSTLNIVLIHRNELWCANVGDSRAVVGRKTGDKGEWVTVGLSRDHKPDCADEAERILSAGGRVASYQDEEGNPLGPARVWLKYQDTPGLAMSRSIGDSVAASAGVIGVPEILHLSLTKDDKFLVVGSDGVFEFMESEEVIDIVASFWESRDAHGACKALEKEAHARWAQDEDVVDDITSVVVFFEVD